MTEIEETGYYYWTAQGSYIPEGKRFRDNLFLRIIARTFEEVVTEFRRRYPESLLHNVTYHGAIHALLTDQLARGKPHIVFLGAEDE